MSSDAGAPDRLSRLRYGFEIVPMNRALGIEVVGATRGTAFMKLPYRPHLVGNPETGVIHGGAITALMDTTCGAAVFTSLMEIRPIATLDLRIDYLKPAEPGRDVIAKGECYKVGKSVAFVRCIAYHDDESDPIASAAAAFMVGQPRAPHGGAG